MYIKVVDIRKRYDGKNVLNKVSFIAGSGEKICLIGKNGSGKTTLLRLIAGLDSPTSGSISKDPPSMTIGYHQQVIMDTQKTIKDFIIASIPSLEPSKAQLDKAFTMDAYEEYESRGGFRIENKIQSALETLGMENTQKIQPSLSFPEEKRPEYNLPLLSLNSLICFFLMNRQTILISKV